MMVERAVARFGQVDIVVNNAGIQHVAPIGEFPAAKWDAILAINLSSAFHLIQATFEPMKQARLRPHHQYRLGARPDRLAVQVGLCRRQARHGRPHQGGGARRRRSRRHGNAICPGYVWTPLVEKQIDDQAKSHNIARDAVIRDVFLKNQPTKRFATVEEMGALTVFLCSDSGRLDHRHRAAGRWRLDRALTTARTRERQAEGGYHEHPRRRRPSSPAPTEKPAALPRAASERINLALQGGGAHGAFTWGVLDRLLEEPTI